MGFNLAFKWLTFKSDKGTLFAGLQSRSAFGIDYTQTEQ
jgi:hypothetical protein